MRLKCSICQKEYEYNRLFNTKYMCNACLSKTRKVKRVQMLDRAMMMLKRKSSSRIYRKAKEGYFDEEYDLLKQKIENGVQFGSASEIVLALEMEKENIRYISQAEICGRHVDFLLPDLRIIVEVDGAIYHTDTIKDLERDEYVLSYMDEDYEIVRIPDENIPRYIVGNLENLLLYILARREKNAIKGCFCDQLFLEEFYLKSIGGD